MRKEIILGRGLKQVILHPYPQWLIGGVRKEIILERGLEHVVAYIIEWRARGSR